MTQPLDATPRAEPRPEAPGARPAPVKPLLRDYLETILICVIFVLFTRAFVFQQSKIPSASMEDTLLIGDYIMVNRFVYGPSATALERALLPMRDVRRGDVMVFKFPRHPEVDYIKRVIGLPGDVVEMRDGYLHVNGERLDEPYVAEAYRLRGHFDFPPITVADGHYFVMGDHRNASEDSRSWGQVPRSLVKGRALMVWWSFPEDGQVYMSAGERLKSWGKKLLYFLPRSRWDRCFKVIR